MVERTNEKFKDPGNIEGDQHRIPSSRTQMAQYTKFRDLNDFDVVHHYVDMQLEKI